MANNKALIGVSSLLLVAAVVGAVCVTINMKSGSSSDAHIASSNKAVTSICQPTDYKQTCESTLNQAAGNITDPTQLVQIAFNITKQYIAKAMKESQTLQQAEKDPQTHDAYMNCKEMLEFSIDDLQRSIERIGTFDFSQVDYYLNDLKTWLSALITYEQTCLDGFENTTTNAAEKMKAVLKKSGELSRNALSMMDGVSQALPGLTGGSRKLLSTDGLPSWVSAGQRRLMDSQVPDNNPLGYNIYNLQPNVVVGPNGQFKTINDALNAIPPENPNTFVIFVEAGVYDEVVRITKKMPRVALIGAGAAVTKITGRRNFADGVKTIATATVAVEGEGFFTKDITYENTAGPEGHQAVALRINADKSIIYNCDIVGFQDTLYAHSKRQLYIGCTIIGTVDFIFGDAEAVFQNCKMIMRMPGPNQACMVTAHGRTYKKQTTGFVIQNCEIFGDNDFKATNVKGYLGRPWKELSRTIIMNSNIDNIQPEGWSPWSGTLYLDTLYYAEFANTGPGADTTFRVNWPGYQRMFTPEQAAEFTAGRFIAADAWATSTGVPFKAGF
ncbi:Pectinesterase [Bertholletia excelsa]